MSNLSEFTINYKVQVNAALGNLEKLNQRTTATNKGLMDAAKGVKELGGSVTRDLSALIPALGRMQSAFAGIAGGAGAAAGAFTLAMKTAMDVRAQFNGQRVGARDEGIPQLRVEDLRRRMVSGNLSQDAFMRGIIGLP